MNVRASAGFATRLLAWHDRHGRHDLPWQKDRTAYRVWVAEIMLQQTQVATAAPYYERFMREFPDVRALAAAAQDEVLHLWSGLGYYARARNLHRAARAVVAGHGGELPRAMDALVALPGIGRSTAAAILAQAHGQPEAILDGNAKRVLARHAGVAGWPGSAPVLRELWGLAEAYTPRRRAAAYTQAIMDLGATVCTRRQPKCGQCPVARDCVARAHGRQHELPESRPRRERPRRSTRMLLALDDDGRVLLVRRPPAGIWGGLWAPPELAEAQSVAELCRGLGLRARGRSTALPVIEHAFSHFDLDIHPLRQRVRPRGVADEGAHCWFDPRAPQRLGLAAPVSALLQTLGPRR